jgi:uncharacterized protein YbjQ (UPF0145 family)
LAKSDEQVRNKTPVFTGVLFFQLLVFYKRAAGQHSPSSSEVDSPQRRSPVTFRDGRIEGSGLFSALPGVNHRGATRPARCSESRQPDGQPQTINDTQGTGIKIMKRLATLTLATCILAVSSVAVARDDVASYSIAEALELEQAKEILGTQITFYFGETKPGNVTKTFGEYGTNKKTNAFNKTDKEACQWVFLSAMVSLRDRAISEGGNAVMNIKSNYKSNLTVSDTTFQCGAGALMAGVALVGTVVTVE